MSGVSPDFLDDSWLLSHHLAKLPARTQMVASLPLYPGDRVLDVGCGGGVWIPLLSPRVGELGQIIGVDRFPNRLTTAARRAAKIGQSGLLSPHVHWVTADGEQLPFGAGVFDLVLCFNCLEYLSSPTPLLQEVLRVLRNGGHVVLKEFDGATMLYHPLSAGLQLRVQHAVFRASEAGRFGFDCFAGRKLFQFARGCGIRVHGFHTLCADIRAPLGEHAERFVLGIAQWQAEVGREWLDRRDNDAWSRAFDRESEDCIVTRSDFFFSVNEFVLLGSKA